MSLVQQSIAKINLLVDSYDDAIEFYTRKLNFTLFEDTELDKQRRWVIIAPPNAGGCSLILSQVESEEQRRAMGNQSGGLVFLILQTNDFWRDYESMKANGVIFLEDPRKEPYGTVAIFEDLYGNKWDLLQPETE